jgi:hypothetical protein
MADYGLVTDPHHAQTLRADGYAGAPDRQQYVQGVSTDLNPSDPYCYIDFDDIASIDPLSTT